MLSFKLKPGMAEKKKETEEQIFEAASHIFRQKGYDGARMQEIADEADINKSMLHYYFRSKDQLFKQVYQREMSRFFPIILKVIKEDKPLGEKVEKFVDVYYDFFEANPRLPQFIIMEMNRHPKRYKKFIKEQGMAPPASLEKQIEQNIENGAMDAMSVEQLMVSTVGLVLFPFVASTMIQALFDFDDEQYDQFMEERKDFLADFILNAINYQKQ